MADRYTVLHSDDIADGAITENELNASVAGNGITGGGGSALAVSPDTTSTTTTEANAVIVGANGVSIKVDDTTLEGSLQGGAGAEDLRIKDGGVSNAKITDDTILEAKLDVTNAPTDGYLLSYDSGSGGFTWVESPATGGVQEDDLANDDFTGSLNGATTDFDLTDVPVTASLQVFINGKLGIEGSGKDYELNPDSGDTKTIRVSPALASTERLIAYYVKDN